MAPDVAQDIEGVVITPLRQIVDERGAVLHMMRSDAPDFTGFGECYFSEVLPRAVKAWKRHLRQTQNFVVPVGRIHLVLFDDRPRSRSHGVLRVLTLGRPDSYFRIQVPPLVWYGFSCVSNTPALLANCADLPHDPAESESRPADDPAIPHRWDIARAPSAT